MSEKRKIDDDGLSEIAGAGESGSESVGKPAPPDTRPRPPIGEPVTAPDTDDQDHGDQHLGE